MGCDIRINEIYRKHLAFRQSHDDLGLQIVDILTTNIRRAMNGNLQVSGWSDIGSLMVESEKGNQVIQIIDLTGKDPPEYRKTKPPYWKVVFCCTGAIHRMNG